MNHNTGAENIRWDLSFLYSGVDDPQIDEDVKELVERAKKFRSDHKGNMGRTLGLAIRDYSIISALQSQVMLYLYLRQSTNVADAAVKAKIAEVERILNHAAGEYMTFFQIEVVGLPEATMELLYKADPVVARHRPWIEHLRVFKKHMLSEEVESALTKRSSFGSDAWAEFFDELEADVEVTYRGAKKTLTEALHLMTESKDPDERFELLTLINQELGKTFGKYSAQTLYMVTGEGSVEQKERKYSTPMEGRNKSNQIPDDVVDILHKVVTETGGPLSKRYYRLKAQLLGQDKLKWSDRNAPMPFTDNTVIQFGDGLKTVLEAYKSFSPTLADIVSETVAQKRIDAPAVKGKRGGAFNYSIVLPDGKPVSFTFLNYMGSNRDVMTLAHELGHGVHGILAGKEQGTLMSHAPIAYCETASVFGEMTTFNFLKKNLAETGNTKSLLALIMGKIDDMMNTAIRQIGFSNLERRLHGMNADFTKWSEPRKLSVSEIDAIWLETLKPFYGADGEIFSYENAEHLWAYIGHFHRPFYVYGYAFGELLTQSLYAQKDKIGNKFESLYLDMLRSGSTRNVVELLEPFGLDPTREQFWVDGLNVGLKSLIDEAEQLAKKI